MSEGRTKEGYRRGQCDVCTMIGLLLAKAVPPDNAMSCLDAGDIYEPVQLVSKDLCLTCVQTPAGVKSENQLHRRLPDEEYTK